MNYAEKNECWENVCHLISLGKETEAIEFCEQEQCLESIDCQRYLGWHYYEQNNLEKALEIFLKTLVFKDAESMFGIGRVYFKQNDFVSALKYFCLASENEYYRANHWIGYMYEYGLGIKENNTLSIKYYKKSAEHGYFIAERAIINSIFKNENFIKKLFVLPKFIFMTIKIFFIANKNINDERLIDIPNAFVKK